MVRFLIGLKMPFDACIVFLMRRGLGLARSNWNLALWLVGVVFCFVGTTNAQTPVVLVTTPSVRLTVEDPNLQPAQYSLELSADGAGVYRSTLSSINGPRDTVRLPVHINEPLLSHLFGLVSSSRFFPDCEPMKGRVAFTGKKTLVYTGPGGAQSCTFNFSSEKAVNDVAAQMMAVAYTLQAGMRLAREQRYDPLGLDDELASLQDSVQEHRAIELSNIRPELQSIASDGSVMNIARKRAHALLSATAR